MSPRKRKIIVGIWVCLFALHYVNVSSFYHSHWINKFLISHSHFYGGDHAKTGTHTAEELSLIATLSSIQTTQVVVCLVGMAVFLVCLAVIRIGTERKFLSITPSGSFLRGPPVVA